MPSAIAGHVTFGCLNNFAKASDPALAAWAEILRAVPGSRLVLHCTTTGGRSRAAAALADRGISPERATFLGGLPAADYFEAYAGIDVGLDPFPYGGGTTTCDALWMGVPVVTLAGETAVGRGGVSILSNVGLPDLIARDIGDYIRLAVALAADAGRLRELRGSLRDRMRASRLMDATRYARDLEALFAEMWRSDLETATNGPAGRANAQEVAGEEAQIPTDARLRTGRRPAALSAGPGLGYDAGVSADPTYLLVRVPADLDAVVTAVGESRVVGVDLETTGLDPRADRVRLIAVDCDTNDGGRFTYLVDAFAVDPAPLLGALADAEVVIHNAAFDLGFLGRLGFTPGRVHDTMLLSQVLYGSARTKGTAPVRHGLKDCCDRELGVTLAKDLQASDWSGPLSPGQLAYAAADAAVLAPLFRKLTQKSDAAGLSRPAAIEAGALPAIAWMAAAGVAFDRAAWQALADGAAADAARLAAELDAAAPAKVDGLFGGTWNWDSPDQVKDALAAAGCAVTSTRDDDLAAVDHPLAALLRDYRAARKRRTTYGGDWLKHVAADGRVYAGWGQLGANSGRMACADPNLQNLPRGAYRRCFAAPPGRVLVKADYSQIELRIAAKVAGDEALMDGLRPGRRPAHADRPARPRERRGDQGGPAAGQGGQLRPAVRHGGEVLPGVREGELRGRADRGAGGRVPGGVLPGVPRPAAVAPVGRRPADGHADAGGPPRPRGRAVHREAEPAGPGDRGRRAEAGARPAVGAAGRVPVGRPGPGRPRRDRRRVPDGGRGRGEGLAAGRRWWTRWPRSSTRCRSRSR